MNCSKLVSPIIFVIVGIVLLLTTALPAHAEPVGPIVDDFSDATKSSLGIDRYFIDDTSAGGKTRTEHSVSDGVLSVRGEIEPPRGQPGWASTVFVLDPDELPQDASDYEGVRLRIRINKGTLSVSANSAEITNFDFHASVVTRQSDGEFHEVKLPFAQMKRVWSEQTPLNTESLVSLSVVAFALQKGSFDFEIAEVSFY